MTTQKSSTVAAIDSPGSIDGALIGGIVGGVLALIFLVAIAATLVFFRRRRKVEQSSTSTPPTIGEYGRIDGSVIYDDVLDVRGD